MIPWRNPSALIVATVVAFTAAGCGDDAVNPANPDASAVKDAAGAETGQDASAKGDAVAEAGDAENDGAAEAGTGDGGAASSD